MNLPKSLTTVTPLSKYLAMFLFVALPFVGFYLGMGMKKEPQVQYVTQEKIVKVKAEENRRDLIKRCGDIPSEDLKINKGHFTVLDGPDWAPDCRHIAWSLWQSGTSIPIDDPATESLSYKGPYPHEGIYLYSDATKQVRKIYSPKKGEFTVAFKKWKDRNTIIFAKGQELFSYDITTGEIQPESPIPTR
mgnify:CR=1 FL=1